MSAKNLRRVHSLAATALSGSPKCALRAVLESERSIPRLPAHPEAILGSVIHEALDKCGNDGPAAVTEYVRRALDDVSLKFESSADLQGKCSLRSVIPAIRVSAKLAAARKIASAMPRSARTRVSARNGSKDVDWQSKPLPEGNWSEVSLTSSELQLTGRVDVICISARGCTIVEFKTGNAATENGVLFENYVDQLHYYQILARKIGYRAPVCMQIIAGDGTFNVEIDEERIVRLEDLVRTITEVAPLQTERDASSLANFGESCSTCSYRPWCDTYVAKAPLHWKETKVGLRLPPDTWGVVKNICSSPINGYCTVYLLDAANRMVCVTGVPDRYREDVLQIGQSAGFFSVRGRGRGTGLGHAQNFSLAVPDNPQSGSHAAAVVKL